MQGLIVSETAISYEAKDLDKWLIIFSKWSWTMYELILFGNLYSFYDVDSLPSGQGSYGEGGLLQKIGRHKRLVLI